MGYIDIVFIIMTIINGIIILFTFPYIILVVIGLFAKRKKYPQAQEKLKYAVVIAGRNEEKVIGQLIESIRKCDYPQDKIDIFVVAHNCTDKTAEVSRLVMKENGGYVYEYNNPQERTKGYALKHAFECIKTEKGIKNYDGYFVFDADNILDDQFFNKMNDAFIYYNKEYAITSFRNSKNFGRSVMTACYGLLFILSCTIESGGRQALGCSSRILGSGFLVSAEMMKNGWTNVILSDDTDFTVEQVLSGKKVMYCDEAMYYDEHPTTLKAMWRQRLRWAKGGLIVCKYRIKSLLKSAYGTKQKDTPKTSHLRFTSLDLISLLFPFAIVSFCGFILNIILLAFSGLFGYNASDVYLWWFISIAMGVGFCYIVLFLLGIICYIKERKRIKNVSLFKKIFSVILWPIFTMLIIPLQIVAVFKKDIAWTQIVHSDTANHECFNQHSVNKENKNEVTISSTNEEFVIDTNSNIENKEDIEVFDNQVLNDNIQTKKEDENTK